MSALKITPLLAGMLLFVSVLRAQGLVSPAGSSYYPSIVGSSYGILESVSSPDSGGYVTCLVRNQNIAPCTITGVTVMHGTDTIPGLPWMAWPMNLPTVGSPGNPWSWVSVKGLSHPFMAGDTFSLIVHTSLGTSSGRIPITCDPLEVKISHIVPGQDEHGLDIFLRNDHSTAVTLDTLCLNQWTWYSFSSGGIRITGGSPSIQPEECLIVHVLEDSLFADGLPIHLRIHWKEAVGAGQGWTTSGVRLVGSEPILGTWHSSGMDPDKEYGRKRQRGMSLGAMQGPGNDGLCTIGFAEYYLKTIREPSFGSGSGPDSALAGPIVRMLANAPWMQCWSIDDEPDLNGKPIQDELLKNYTYLLNDPGTPSFVNLAVQHKFNRYGWFSDIVAQDHYAAADAPNIIPNTWIPFIGREGKLDEAVEYTDLLKRNTEPRRLLAWSQLNSGVWGSQPQPHAIDHQFWGQVMAGAKGILWFTAQSDLPEQAPALWERSLEISRQWTGIRELLMHSEPFGNVSCSTPDVIAGLLAGEEAATLIVLNQTADFSFNTGTLKWTSSMDTVSYSATFRMPDWISTPVVRMLTPEGYISQPAPVSLGGGLYQFTPTLPIADYSHVFVIGSTDTQSPQAPSSAQIPEYIDLANYTISWSVARDNRGIAGYEVAWNGIVADTVTGPLFEVIDGAYNCNTGNWSIRAIDLDGNISPPTFLPITISIPDPVITGHPADLSVMDGVDTFFTASGSGDGIHYRWQMNTGGIWADLSESWPFSGTTTDTLWLMNTPDSLDGRDFRCIVTNPCLAADTSLPAKIGVYVGLEDDPLLGWRVYPNPTTDAWILQAPEGACAMIRIYYSTGALLFQEELCSGSPIMGDRLPGGLYLIEIHTQGHFKRIPAQVIR